MISEAQRKRMEENKARALARLNTKTNLQNSAINKISESHLSMDFPQKPSYMGQQPDIKIAHKRFLEENNAKRSNIENTHPLFPSNMPLTHKDYITEAEKRYPSYKKIQTRLNDSFVGEQEAARNIVSGPIISKCEKISQKKIEISLELSAWDRVVVQIQDLNASKDFFGWLFNLVSEKI